MTDAEAKEIKGAVSRILDEALRGVDRYLYRADYVRWGLVERDMHEAIDAVVNTGGTDE